MKKAIIFILFALFTLHTFPLQNGEETLHLLGWVIKDEQPLRQTSIGIWQNDKLIQETRPNRRGHFSFDLPLESKFTLTFSAPGHVTKRVSVDTRLTGSHQPGKYHSFEFEVDMIENSARIREEFFDDPVAIVYYDSYEYLFGYDQQYFAYYQARFEEMLNPGVSAPVASYLASLEQAGSNTAQAQVVAGPRSENHTSIPNTGYYYSAQQSAPAASVGNIHSSGLSHADRSQILLPANSQTSRSTRSVVNAPVVSADTGEPAKLAPTSYVRYAAPAAAAYKTPSEFLPHGVVFSVQVLATARPVGENYFTRLQTRYPGEEIIQFRDQDNLDKYTVGVFSTMDQAMEKLWVLRGLNYETYIIAFKDGRKVRVKEALAGM